VLDACTGNVLQCSDRPPNPLARPIGGREPGRRAKGGNQMCFERPSSFVLAVDAKNEQQPTVQPPPRFAPPGARDQGACGLESASD
jgi:hypothetical protein